MPVTLPTPPSWAPPTPPQGVEIVSVSNSAQLQTAFERIENGELITVDVAPNISLTFPQINDYRGTTVRNLQTNPAQRPLITCLGASAPDDLPEFVDSGGGFAAYMAGACYVTLDGFQFHGNVWGLILGQSGGSGISDWGRVGVHGLRLRRTVTSSQVEAALTISGDYVRDVIVEDFKISGAREGLYVGFGGSDSIATEPDIADCAFRRGDIVFGTRGASTSGGEGVDWKQGYNLTFEDLWIHDGYAFSQGAFTAPGPNNIGGWRDRPTGTLKRIAIGHVWQDNNDTGNGAADKNGLYISMPNIHVEDLLVFDVLGNGVLRGANDGGNTGVSTITRYRFAGCQMGGYGADGWGWEGTRPTLTITDMAELVPDGPPSSWTLSSFGTVPDPPGEPVEADPGPPLINARLAWKRFNADETVAAATSPQLGSSSVEWGSLVVAAAPTTTAGGALDGDVLSGNLDTFDAAFDAIGPVVGSANAGYGPGSGLRPPVSWRRSRTVTAVPSRDVVRLTRYQGAGESEPGAWEVDAELVAPTEDSFPLPGGVVDPPPPDNPPPPPPPPDEGGFDFTSRDQLVIGTTTSFTDLAPDTLYYLRVQAIDSSGNTGPWSNPVAVRTQRVVEVDIDDSAISTEKLQDYAVSAIKLGDAAIIERHLSENAITAAAIADAAIGTDQLGPGVVTADKLIVGNFDNLVTDPNFATGDEDLTDSQVVVVSLGGGTVTLDATSPRTGTQSLLINSAGATGDTVVALNRGAVSAAGPDDQFYFGAWIRATGDPRNNHVRLIVQPVDAAGVALTASYLDIGEEELLTNTWTYRAFTSTPMPANTVGVRFLLSSSLQPGGGGRWRFSGVYARRVMDAAILADASIISAKIADAQINTAHIDYLDAAVFSTGVLDAERIGTKTLTTDKLVVGSFDNLISDPIFSLGSGTDWSASPHYPVNAGGQWSLSGTQKRVGTQAAYYSTTGQTGDATLWLDGLDTIPAGHPVVAPGQQVMLSCWCYPTVATHNTVGIGINWYNADGYYLGQQIDWRDDGYLTHGVWTEFSVSAAAPANAAYYVGVITVLNTGKGGAFYFDQAYSRIKVGTAVIEDAAIVSAKIGTLEVKTANIDTGAVNSLKIANGSINTAHIGTLTVDGAWIANATIGAAKIASVDAGTISTGTLSAARIAAGSLTADKLTTGTITTTTITLGTSSSIKTSNYSSGTAGWSINSAGDAEFNNLTVRGTIANASIGAGHVITVSSTGYIGSSNYSAGSAGWRIKGDGTAEFNSVTVRGTLASANGTFTGALSGGTISIGSGNNIFKADSNGVYLGNATFGSAPFRVSMAGSVTTSNLTVTGGTIGIGTKFSVASDGAMSCSGATISGAITATSFTTSMGSSFNVTMASTGLQMATPLGTVLLTAVGNQRLAITDGSGNNRSDFGMIDGWTVVLNNSSSMYQFKAGSAITEVAGNPLRLYTSNALVAAYEYTGGVNQTWFYLPESSAGGGQFLACWSGSWIARYSSSERGKADVVPLDRPIARERMRAIRPVSYVSTLPLDVEHYGPEKRWNGLIAEELAAVDPSLATWGRPLIDEVIGEDADGNPLTRKVEDPDADPQPNGIAVFALLAELITFVQDLDARLAAVERRGQP